MPPPCGLHDWHHALYGNHRRSEVESEYFVHDFSGHILDCTEVADGRVVDQDVNSSIMPQSAVDHTIHIPWDTEVSLNARRNSARPPDLGLQCFQKLAAPGNED